MRGPLRSASAALWSAAALACLALASCAIAAPEPDQPVPPSDGATIAAFYGDSYTRGTGASSPERRWSTIVCAERGWYEFNPSFDGIGYVNNRGLVPGGDLVDQIVDHEPSPDVVIVTMGLNDAFSMPSAADEVREAIIDDLERFRTELPDARLVVVEPFWYQDDRPDEFEQIVEWVEDAASRVDADYIPGASHWLEGHPEWMSSDVIHPNDDGYAELARRMDAQLERLGL